MTFKISEEDNIPFASPSDSQLMELEHIRISKPEDDYEETEEAVPLSCAFTRQEHCIVGGYKANSLAVMTDAAHLLSDVAGLCVSLLAIKISSWEANPRNSFGFKRLEVLAAFLSVQLIWLVSGVIIYEAIQRLLTRSREVNGGGIIWVKPKWVLVDLICTLVFSAFALAATFPMLKNIFDNSWENCIVLPCLARTGS
ncbi:hypothetical protein HID58_015748 [Brassica napus]|uniref:Cation efflux protein transmembrane domain-containing protein n=1 Tax=Brassica napus TaxID=3708 RepID=A0ABQ8DNJ0_BRANA|nr:hypothetical protein HID58_015748 [Brassica napus]